MGHRAWDRRGVSRAEASGKVRGVGEEGWGRRPGGQGKAGGGGAETG